jgi:group II intron reverse transcriptase/maturase
MQTSLKGINKRAKKDSSHQFGGLYRLLNIDNLRWAFSQLNKRAAVGVDKVSYAEYGQNLEENLKDLVSRLKNKSYKARLIRRHYIPKSATKMRPLGIPTLEDKLVQYATAKILEAIYEADFIKDSYGYRPHRGCHDAVKIVKKRAMFANCNHVVEADIKGFFDNIDHDWLMKMLGRRIEDTALLKLIYKWLKAGIMEEGKVIYPESGTPQGGVISPILANIYLHYALDLWFENRVSRSCVGRCSIVRYADDFVCLFQHENEAQYFYEQLPLRLKKFNLEVAPEKTNKLKFSRFNSRKENESFEFLGFEFHWELSRRGKKYVRARTSGKKLRGAIERFTNWIQENRSKRLRPIMESVRRKFIGHYNYYGLIGNSKRLSDYWFWCLRSLFKWLNRRSQKRSYNWTGFNELITYFTIPTPRVTENIQQLMLPFNNDL